MYIFAHVLTKYILDLGQLYISHTGQALEKFQIVNDQSTVTNKWFAH